MVIRAPREGGVELFRVHAGDMGSEAGPDHLPSQPPSVLAPKRKERLDAGAREAFLPIPAHVFEEKIPERDLRDAVGPRMGQGLGHGLFIDLVRAGMWNEDLDEREAGRGGLGLEQRFPHGMHGHAPGLSVQGGEETHDLDRAFLTQPVQGPGTVLAAGPRKEGCRSWHERSPCW